MHNEWDDLEPLAISRLRLLACAMGVMGTAIACGAALLVWLSFLSSPLLPLAALVSCGLLGMAVMYWMFALWFAPRFAVHLVAVSTVAVCLLWPLPCWLLQNRELSRRYQVMNNLKQVALKQHAWDLADERKSDFPAPLGLSGELQQLPQQHPYSGEYFFDEPQPDAITLTSTQRYPAYEP